jgi:hypothetical protein
MLAQAGVAKLYVKFDASKKTHAIKWYLPDFIYHEPVVLWAKYNNQEWIRLSEKSFSFSNQTQYEIQTKDDRAAFDLCLAKGKLSGVALLQVLKQSFSSLALCQKIGIAFQYKITDNVTSVQYKLTSEKTGIVYLESGIINATEDFPKPSVIELAAKQNKKIIDLIWKDYPETIWGIVIQRKTNDSADTQAITAFPLLQNSNKNALNTPNYIDKNVQEKQHYTYHLSGINYFGDTITCSNSVKVLLKDVTAPPSVQTIIHSIKKSTVQLNWQQTSDDDIRTFAILRTSRSDTDYRELGRIPFKEGLIKYHDTVPNFQSYYYKVRSIDAEGNFSDSHSLAIDVPDTEAPLPAIIKESKADSNFISIKWDNKITKDWAGCYVFRSINDTASSYFVRITPEPVKNQFYTDTLPTNTKNRYFYKVISLDSSLNFSQYSNIATAVLPDKTAPSAPFITECIAGKNKIKINWFRNPETDLHHYEITIVDTVANYSTKMIRIHKDSTDFDYELKVSHAYLKIHLIAVDSAGNQSKISNQHAYNYRANRLAETKPIEVDLKGKLHSETLSSKIVWNCTETEQVKGFTVFRAIDNASETLPISGFISERNDFIDASIEKQHIYSYHIRALLLDGQIIHSNTIQIKTYTHENNKFRLRKK